MTIQSRLNSAVQRLILAYKFTEEEACLEVKRAKDADKEKYIRNQNKLSSSNLNREGRRLIWDTIHG
jgi:hypothetical protein